MNQIVNPHNRPYIVMEGLVDSNMIAATHCDWATIKNRNIIYAGGLYERYGVEDLVKAFMKLPHDNVSLQLYGSGSMVDKINCYAKEDSRIKFYGTVPNEVVVQAELEASLLINHRPTHEDFTKYSFPSKNMEYMVSGTPLITTLLPGMPLEYHEYVYLFDEESVEGYYKKLIEVLEQTNQQLQEKGERAKQFVLQDKNNIVQSSRIADLLK
jgi:glycosyltransferase involved in cell wall biosynthesis